MNEVINGFYYPSRMGFSLVKIGNCKMLASNDFGAASHEDRHFIDAETLEALEGGANMIDTLVECVPRCIGMDGKGMSGQSVLGMLAAPLLVIFKIGSEEGSRKQLLMLDRVVVVRQLPVPLHISIKRLQRKSNSKKATAESKEAVGLVLESLFSNRTPALDFQASNLPEQFRPHPFWAEDGIEYIGMGANSFANTAYMKSYSKSAVDSVQAASCEVCNALDAPGAKLLKCGRCLRVFYCCKDHQLQDWKNHKSICTKP